MKSIKNIIEFIENILRSERLSEQDCRIMFKKGYYYDIEKERFVKWEGGE